MQPYFFPYIGYFQLIHAVNTFVVYDDVNFIKGGWINRNFILSQGEKTRITLQLRGASSYLLINQIIVGENQVKLLKSIHQSYAKAPHCSDIMLLIERVLMNEEKNLAKYLAYGLKEICSYLGLTPKWILSSDLQKDNTQRGQEKVLSICHEMRANHYINTSGGRSLYENLLFEKNGIKLSFISSKDIEYKQHNKPFESFLSIIDVMMFNDREQCLKLIQEYSLE
ncbi:MAG: hypothetical protein D3916_18130 [Candidatus Electrothrix sp. MAN1_4]|nr:hypothetical protein [Candidatus Electrothrix sp. MAN1_4]